MLTDPYRPPASAVVQPERRERRLYSPNQIAFATFVGTVAAGCFLMGQNFAALGRRSARWGTCAGGLAAALVLFAIGELVPSIPGLSLGLNVASLVVVRSIAQDLQGDELRARLEQGVRLHSTWRAFGVSVLVVLCLAVANLMTRIIVILARGS